MKGTKCKQKSEQPNHSPGLQGHTKRFREPALKQKSIQSGPKCGFTSAWWIHPLLHLKVGHVKHGIRPIEQVSVPAPNTGVACALKNKTALVLALALLANYANPVGPRYPRESALLYGQPMRCHT